MIVDKASFQYHIAYGALPSRTAYVKILHDKALNIA